MRAVTRLQYASVIRVSPSLAFRVFHFCRAVGFTGCPKNLQRRPVGRVAGVSFSDVLNSEGSTEDDHVN
jgi:hypothetical protein